MIVIIDKGTTQYIVNMLGLQMSGCPINLTVTSGVSRDHVLCGTISHEINRLNVLFTRKQCRT